MEETSVSQAERAGNTMHQHDSAQPSMQSIRRMLREMIRIAKDASLTGALAGGAALAVQQYNRTLENMERTSRVPAGWFQPLPPGSSLDEVGIVASQLDSFLEAEMIEKEKKREAATHRHEAEATATRHSSHQDSNGSMLVKHIVGLAPFVEQAQLIELLRTYFRDDQTINPDTLVKLAPFVGKEELSRIIREHLSGWPHHEATKRADTTQQPEGAQASTTGTGAPSSTTSLATQLQDIARQLQDSGLTLQQRAALAEQLARLGQEQSSQVAEIAKSAEAADNSRQTRPL